MSAKQKKPLAPSLCERVCKSTGRTLTYATFNGRYVAFGPAGADATRRYEEFVARWLSNGRTLPAEAAAEAPYSVDDLVADYLDHAKAFYAGPVEGKPGAEYRNLRAALAPVQEMFGAMPAADFGPLALRAVREQMVEGGALCRKEINNRVHRIRRAWRWAASMEKVPGSACDALATVAGLRVGKTIAREYDPVRPVSEREVRAAIPHLCSTVAAMVWFGWWTGCRPGEACALRWNMIDRTGPVWIAELDRHKNAWRGRSRWIAIGPKAQEHLRPLLVLDQTAFVFSPRRALAEQRADKAERRKSKVQPSQRRRAEQRRAHPREQIAEAFTTHTLGRAIARGVQAANAALVRARIVSLATELGGEQLAAKASAAAARLSTHRCVNEHAELRLDVVQLAHLLKDKDLAAAAVKACAALALFEPWGPNRLRHSAATRIRKEEGLEAARVVLGHARTMVTEVYAEADHERSRAIMARLG